MNMTTWETKELPIGEIERLLSEGYDIEVDGPDGFVPVTAFIHKGVYDEHVLVIDGGESQAVRCNAAHLFETQSGWQSAGELSDSGASHIFLTRNGLAKGRVTKMGRIIPIVDIQVDHPNHRYYTESVSSHNTNVGKSLFLVHMAAACLRMSKNVLYITLEMAEERIAERIDANTMNLPMDDVTALPRAQYMRKIESLRLSSTGRVIIKEYPTAAAHVGHFRALFQELRAKQNFVPDIVYVDYLSICASARVKMGASINSYTYNKSIAEELRGLAVEFDIPIFTAAQFNRDGASSSDPGLDKISESYAIAQTADFIVAMTTSEELEKNNQIQIYTLKNRYGKRQSYQKFLLGVDTSRMKLYETGNTSSNEVDFTDAAASTSDTFQSSQKSGFGFSNRARRPLGFLKTDAHVD